MAETEQLLQELLTRLKDPPPQIPLIDPTANVLSLVTAAIQRQDDLRSAEFKRQDDLREQEAKYQRDLGQAESRRIDALALAESRRIDALLAAQKNDVAIANEKQATVASTLALQVSTSAEALRAQVAAAAAAQTESVSTLRDIFDKRIATVEQNQYQSGGRDLGVESSRARNTVTVNQLLLIGGLIISAVVALHQLHVI